MGDREASRYIRSVEPFELDRHPTDSDVEELRQRLIAYNIEKAGNLPIFQMGIFLRDDQGVLTAGVYGFACRTTRPRYLGACCHPEFAQEGHAG
jgi:hypothetical protein